MTHTDASNGVRPIWPWVLFCLALGLHVWWNLTDVVSLGVFPSYFLPLLTGWLAYTRGWQVIYVLIALVPLVLVSVSLSTDTLHASWTIWADGYLLSIGTAVAFAGPWRGASLGRFLRPWSRTSLWMALALLWLLATVVPEIELIDGSDHSLALNLTIPALLCVATASVRWREIAAAIPRGPRWRLAVVAAFVLLALLTLRAYFDVSEILGLRIGNVAPGEALLALGFFVTAWRILDWRALALVLAILAGVLHLGQPLLSSVSDSAPNGSPITPISAVVLGAALSSFWLSRGAKETSATTSVGFVLLLLALQVLEPPGVYDGFVVGGIAFLGGLVWKFRSLIAMPLVLQLAHVLCCLRAQELGDSLGSLPRALVTIGAVAFFHAFFGLLANRFAVEDEIASLPARALEAAT